MLGTKVFDQECQIFYKFVANLLAGQEPDSLEVPECGQWKEWAEQFHYEYDQAYSMFDGDFRSIERLKRVIKQQMKEDPDMHQVLGSLFVSNEQEIKVEGGLDEEALADDGIKNLLKMYQVPKLEKISFTYKDGRVITADPIMLEGLGKQARRFIDECVSWLGKYAKWSHPLFLEGTAIWLLSVISARRIYMDITAERYTPLNILFIADSSEYSKSYPPKLAILLLKEAKLGWLLAPDNMTPPMYMVKSNPKVPADYDMLDEGQRAYTDLQLGHAGKLSIFFDEMGNRFGSMLQATGTYAPWLEWILKMDGCPDELPYHTAKHGELEIKNPYLTFLGCMTPDDFLKIPRGSANPFQRGLMGRTMVYTPPRLDEPNLEVTNLLKPEIPENLVNMLKQFDKDLGHPVITVTGNGEDRKAEFEYPEHEAIITPEVAHAHEQYVQALKIMLYKREEYYIPPELRPSYIRMPIKTLRIAAMLAFMHNGGIITLEEWAAAQDATERARYSMHEFFNQITGGTGEITQERKDEDRLLTHIKTKGGWVKPWEIAQSMGVSTKQAQTMLESLKLAGTMDLIDVKGKNGRKMKVYCDPSCPVPEKYVNSIVAVNTQSKE